MVSVRRSLLIIGSVFYCLHNKNTSCLCVNQIFVGLFSIFLLILLDKTAFRTDTNYMYFKVISSLTFFSIILLFCDQEPTNSGIVLTRTDSGKEINIPFNTFFKIQLSGNISTGSSWYVSNIDKSILSQKGKPVYQDSSSGKGTGGLFIFTFNTSDYGKSELKFKYGREFEPQNPAVDSFSVTINVK